MQTHRATSPALFLGHFRRNENDIRQGGSLPVVLAFEWKPWLRPWAEQPAVFPHEESTVSQLWYLTCSPDLSGFLFCFYIVNTSASWVSGDSYWPQVLSDQMLVLRGMSIANPRSFSVVCLVHRVWWEEDIVEGPGVLGNLWGFLKDTAPREFLGTEPVTHQFPDRLHHTGIHPHTLVFLGF